MRCINMETWVWLLSYWCDFRKKKCWYWLLQRFLMRKQGTEQWSKSIARRTEWWWLGCTQKVQMVKCTPHRSYYAKKLQHTFEKENIMHIYIKGKLIFKDKAKVCATAKRKTTYSPVIWWHIALARCYMRKYKYVQL